MEIKNSPVRNGLLFVITILLAVFLLTVFTSCEPEREGIQIVPNTHLIIVNASTPNIYYLADLRDPYAGDIKMMNGDIYNISYVDNSAYILSDLGIKEAYYYTDALDRTAETLEIINNNITYKKGLTEHGNFRIIY